jgi:surface antigen
MFQPEEQESAMPSSLAGRFTGLIFATLWLGGCFGGSEPPVASSPAGVAAPQPASGFIAGPVSASLNEQDRERGFKAQIDAAETGRRISWRGETTSYGFVEPGADGIGGCRAYTHTIYLDGRAQRGSGQACKKADGNWSFS